MFSQGQREQPAEWRQRSRSEEHQDVFIHSQKVLFVPPAFTMAQCFSSSSSSIGLLFLLVVYTAAGKGCNCASGFEVDQSEGQWSEGSAKISDVFVAWRNTFTETWNIKSGHSWASVCVCVFSQNICIQFPSSSCVTADVASFLPRSSTHVSSWASSAFGSCKVFCRTVTEAHRKCVRLSASVWIKVASFILEAAILLKHVQVQEAWRPTEQHCSQATHPTFNTQVFQISSTSLNVIIEQQDSDMNECFWQHGRWDQARMKLVTTSAFSVGCWPSWNVSGYTRNQEWNN